MTCSRVFLKPCRKLNAIHNWHHNIAYHKLRHITVRHLKSLFAVCSLNHIIFLREQRTQICPHAIVVVDDKYKRAVVVKVLCIGYMFGKRLGIGIGSNIAVVYHIAIYSLRCSRLILGSIISRLCIGYAHNKGSAFTRLAFGMHITIMHVHVCLD